MATTTAAATALSCSTHHLLLFPQRTLPSGSRRRWGTARAHRRRRLARLHVVDDSRETQTQTQTAAGGGGGERSSEADKLVEGLDFGELCDDFQCISSPYVESTARQIVRDILEIREGSRALSCYAVSVRYRDPLRTFVGREKYKRPLWITKALENPKVTVQEMSMQSTSELTIRWTLRGKPRNGFFSAAGGELVIRVESRFTLNQISGQVLEHVESWDLSGSSPPAQAYFWLSRRVYAAVEAGKDTVEAAKGAAASLSEKKDENLEVYPDPSGDPTKFFTRPDELNQDVYQIALFLAVLYFIVQYLKTTL